MDGDGKTQGGRPAKIPLALYTQLHVSPSNSLMQSVLGAETAGMMSSGSRSTVVGTQSGGYSAAPIFTGTLTPRVAFSSCVSKKVLLEGGEELERLVDALVETLAG